jgi:hypothetical protein
VAQVQITHTGSGELTGLAVAIEYQTGSGWLTAELSSTTTPSTLTLTAPSAVLQTGSYTATVSVSATGVTPQTVTVHLTITISPLGGERAQGQVASGARPFLLPGDLEHDHHSGVREPRSD